MRNRLILIAAVFSFLFIEGCSALFVKDNSEYFVKVNGTRFEINSEPYYFVGTNFWYGCYLGSPGATGDRERLKSELDLLVSLGVTNLRVLAASEETAMRNSLKPAVQSEPGIYNQELLEGLDYLLSEMGKRNMRAVLFLNNYWEWSGGMSQYNAWSGAGNVVDPADPNYTWDDFNEYVSSFYRNEKANTYYREFVKMIVTRVNKFTGKFYFEDPAIMAWQLANEPRPGQGDSAVKYINYYYKWIDETAAYIHSLDPNHLVTTGNEGYMGSMESSEYYLKAHESKNIDYVTFHMWAKNWSWYNAQKPDSTFPRTKVNAVNYLAEHFAYARQLNKPITLEEFGIGRDYEKTAIGSPTTIRDEYYKLVFKTVYDSAMAGAPIAGTNFWTWGGEGRASSADAVWKEGDPFTGDPPQEPQGLNSVFDADQSTLDIIKEYAEKMNTIKDYELAVK